MASRSYVVGVPLIVSVDDDGVVTYEVDASEISSEMSERFGEDDEDGIEENQMLLDGAVIDGHLAAGNFGQTHLTQMVRVECPVKYRCKFECFSLEEMASHIETFDHSDVSHF
jgi:hypothetical protein